MDLEAALRSAAPGIRISREPPDRDAYARDLWPRGLIEHETIGSRSGGPRAIVWPESVEQVSALVRFAREAGIALVPFGAGSGVCGGVLPDADSIVVDLKRIADHRVGAGPELDVGAGALGIDLEESLLRAGFTTGHYPSSILISTAGGWAAARGAGQCSGRYGKIEDMITRLEVVLGTGEVVRAHRRTMGGIDLTPLIIGSEGTLGIVTRVGMRLHPAPAARAFSSFSFDSVETGVRALRRLFQDGLRPAVARLYDPLDTFLLADDDAPKRPPLHPPGRPGLGAAALRTVLRRPSVAARAMATAERTLYSRAALVLVHEGDADDVESESLTATRLCLGEGATALGEGPARAWFRHRYHVSYRQAPTFRGGAFVDTMEVAAPWSRLLGVYDAVRSALARDVLVMAHFSHSYPDGASIYFTFAGSLRGPEDPVAIYDRAWRRALSAALEAGASLSHHHGVGRSKAPRLREELGAGIAVIRALKAGWDPDHVLNPGVLLPPISDAERRDAPQPPDELELDRESALCSMPGATRVGDVEQWLVSRGHTLDLDPRRRHEIASLAVDEWVGLGLPGMRDPYDDPAGARIAAMTATLLNGRRFSLRPSPRRAVGPDLTALLVGTAGQLGRVDALTLAAPRLGAGRPRTMPFAGARQPPLEAAEGDAFARLRAALLR